MPGVKVPAEWYMLDHGNSEEVEHMTVLVSFGVNQAKPTLNMVKTCKKWDILELLEKEGKSRAR